MTDFNALIWTIIVGGGLLYMGHYITAKTYQLAWQKLMAELHKEGYLDIQKVNKYLESKYAPK